jgi:hypothetical protein
MSLVSHTIKLHLFNNSFSGKPGSLLEIWGSFLLCGFFWDSLVAPGGEGLRLVQSILV